MRSKLRAALSLFAAFAVVLTLAVGPVAQAQDATPGPFCALLTPQEVSKALEVDVTVSEGTDLDSDWESDFEAGVFLTLYARVESGSIADSIKIAFPDGTDLTVGGKPAYYVEDLLWVEVGGRLLTLQLVSFETEGPDHQAVLTQLAEIGVGRFDSMSIPEATPEPSALPEPSFVGDPELDAMFPDEIGGQPVEVTSLNGQELLASIDTTDPENAASLQALQDALAARGKTIDDMSFGYSVVTTEANYAVLYAVRVKGVTIADLQAEIMPIFTNQMSDPQQTPAVVGGKSVTIVTDGPNGPDAEKLYAYGTGDVLWMVTADDPDLTEIFQKLP